MGQSVALKLQSVLYLEHILNTFGHFIGIIRIGASGPGPEMEKYGILFTTKRTTPPTHIYMRSPSLVVTLHAALENDTTVPAG